MTKKSIMRSPEEIKEYLAKRAARKNKNTAKKITKELEVSDKVKDLEPKVYLGMNKVGNEWLIERTLVDTNAKLMTQNEVLVRTTEKAYAIEQLKILLFKNFMLG